MSAAAAPLADRRRPPASALRGAAGPGPDDLRGHLMSCHTRMRRAVAALEAVAGAPPAGAGPGDGAALARYLRLGLPQHAEDEAGTVEPRLHGRSAELDLALARMDLEHERIEGLIARVLPGLEGRGPTDRGAAGALARLLLAHMEAEERLIFPHIDALAPADRSAAVAELRARRSP